MKCKNDAASDAYAATRKKDLEGDDSNVGYVAGIYSYAERWADLLEAEIAKGSTVPAVAYRTSHKADTEGVTGFMYSLAVQLLVAYWEHGEALRLWHNLANFSGTRGEEANKQPGVVLNTAILHIAIPEKEAST